MLVDFTFGLTPLAIWGYDLEVAIPLLLLKRLARHQHYNLVAVLLLVGTAGDNYLQDTVCSIVEVILSVLRELPPFETCLETGSIVRSFAQRGSSVCKEHITFHWHYVVF